MGDTLAFAPAPLAGALSGKRTVGSAPARGTGATRSSDGEAPGVGEPVPVDADDDGDVDGDDADCDGDEGDADGDAGGVALAVAFAVGEAEDAEGLAPLQPAAKVTAATARAVRASLT